MDDDSPRLMHDDSKKGVRPESGKIQLLLDLCVLQALFGFPAIFRRDINTDIPSL
jgi:hypothetical protein